MNSYTGLIPCCGVFCGSCPNYIRDKNKCCGAEKRCEERQCGIYKCCVENKLYRFCFECKIFPCSRFKKFAETWKKLGQNLIENQYILKESGEDSFLIHFNLKKTESTKEQ